MATQFVIARPSYSAIGLASAAMALAGWGVWLFASNMQIGAITADWAWLYRTGQAIWADGIPNGDLWSWSHFDQPWVLYQWLFEAISAPIYDLLGPAWSVAGVTLFGVAIYVGLPTLYHGQRGVHPLWVIAVGGWVLIPVSTNLGLRPMLASNLALLAQFWLVQAMRRRRCHWWVATAGLALIYALWANMHLGFTLGLLSLSLFAIGDLWSARQTSASEIRQHLGIYAALIGVAVLATGLNPYGWTLYGYIIELSLKNRMNAHIHELMPPDWHNPYMLFGAAMIGLFVVVALIRRHVLEAVELLHMAAFTIMAFGSMRFVVWSGLFYVLIVPRLFQQAAIDSTPPSVTARLNGLNPYAARNTCTAVFAIIAGLIAIVGAPVTAGSARLADCAPLQSAVVYLDRRYPADTRWFASENAGSCTRFYAPRRRVFIDTRFDMFPEPFVMAWFYAYQYRQNWRALFDTWRIRVVLLARGAPLRPILERDSDFKAVYRDQNAVIYERRPDTAGRGAIQTSD